MANRVYPANTTGKSTSAKIQKITFNDASLAGHVIEVHGDAAIWDTTSGLFISPETIQIPYGANKIRFGLGAI